MNESKKRDKHLHVWDGTQKLGKDTGGFGNQRKNQEHPDYNIKIG